MPFALAFGLVVVSFALAASIGGIGGVAYVVIWALACLPGLPIGFRWFGRRHAAGWIAGGLIGYAMAAVAIWLAIVLRATSLPAMVGVWALVSILPAWLFRRAQEPLVSLPPWTRRDSIALLAFLWLVPILAGPAFVRVDSLDRAGNHLFRAYFTADYLWHVAVTAEMSRLSLPPMNPYMAAQPLHYYWTYFLLPAAASAHGAGLGISVEHALLVNALGSGALLFGMLFVTTWAAVPRAAAVLSACSLAVVGASAEGLYALWRLWQKSRPLLAVRDLNIDAMTSWDFQGLRIDGLPRSLWYVPQHAMSAALGLLALSTIVISGPGGSLPAIAAGGIALACATIMSPILGAGFALVYGVCVTIGALRTPKRAPTLVVRHAVAAIPVVLALLWCEGNRVFEGAHSALRFGFGELAANSPVLSLAIGLGPLLAAAIGGLVARRWDSGTLVGLAGLLVGSAAYYLCYVPLDLAYVGFRAGQILQLAAPILVARFFALAQDPGRRWAVVGAGVMVFAIGLPTTVIDAYNAQDTTNRREAPGFRWTMAVTPAEYRAARWLRTSTPVDAVVQSDPVIRGRSQWTFIPSFAHRRMAAGLPISLLMQPEYTVGASLVHEMFATESAAHACRIAHDLDIDYIYIDAVERTGLNLPSIDKFANDPGCFHEVLRSAEVQIFAVAPAVVPRR